MFSFVNRNFDQDQGSAVMHRFFNVLMLVFLIGNLIIRFGTIFYYPPYNGYIAAFLGCVVFGCVFTVFFPTYLKIFLFLFGFSFFLFGFPSIDLQSRIFEIIVTCVTTTLFVINYRTRDNHRLNRRLVILISCYVSFSLFSLLLLPVKQIAKDLWFFGFPDFFFYLFIDQPCGFYYPVAAVIRLMLFAALAVQLASLKIPADSYKSIFVGLFTGALICAFMGLLDFYGVISLAWYRFGKTKTPGVLHATFGNRGVFAEFVLTVVPFVLIGFMNKRKGLCWPIFLFGSLVVCEISLILAGARAGWVSYPVVLFICWLFFYFSKEERFETFRFKWRDFVKVAVSVPITIVLSFLLIFYVFMPFSDYLKNETGIKGTGKDSKSTSKYIARQTSRLIDPSNRITRWKEGFNVARENPLFGAGYESFCRHASILIDIPESYYSQNPTAKVKQTPHNIFLQLFVSGGIAGLCLWAFIIGYGLMLLLVDLIRHKRLLNIPVIISIISFHTYGIFQSMQYMPMIWSLIFLSLGYAMTIDDGVLPVRVRRVTGFFTKASVALVVIGFFVYLTNFESRSLAEKYGKRIYATDQERDRFAGFFQPSKRWKYGDYRWFGKKGAIYVPGGGDIELDFHCRTPGLEKVPVTVTVFHDGRVLDEIYFSGQKAEDRGRETKTRKKKRGQKKKTDYTVRRKYQLPVTPGETQNMVLEVSRTWIPHNVLGNFDRRELGLGVKIVKSDGNQLNLLRGVNQDRW